MTEPGRLPFPDDEDRPVLAAPLLKLHVVARQLGITVDRVRRFIRDQHLAGVHLGKEWRVKPDDLEAFIAGQREPARQSTVERRRANAGDRRRAP